jgi:hypothetical protein
VADTSPSGVSSHLQMASLFERMVGEGAHPV